MIGQGNTEIHNRLERHEEPVSNGEGKMYIDLLEEIRGRNLWVDGILRGTDRKSLENISSRIFKSNQTTRRKEREHH